MKFLCNFNSFDNRTGEKKNFLLQNYFFEFKHSEYKIISRY